MKMETLLEGNKRFKEKKSINKEKNVENPSYLIVICPDLKDNLEELFDQPKGSFFVLRNVGAIINEAVLSSIEYAVKEYNIELIIVLGNQNCRRIKECVKIPEIIDYDYMNLVAETIKEGILKAKARKGDIINNSVQEVVKLSIQKIRKGSEYLSILENEKHLKIVGMYFDGKNFLNLA
ncbi:carbonic anhydrase [Pseudomonadota bacterium]